MRASRNELLRQFTIQLLRLEHRYLRRVNRRLADEGLSVSRALPVLQIARSGDGLRQGELAEALGLEGPSLVRLLDQLSADGLLERRDDPRDRRAKTLHLLPKGQALAARLEELLAELRTELLSGVSVNEIETALRVFASFDRALDQAAAEQAESER